MQIPRTVAFREDLPKSLIGKVLRRKLREEAAAEKVISL
jgi:acyl-coenzyme A synthetase/AMP-(fatty) acid ligase